MSEAIHSMTQRLMLEHSDRVTKLRQTFTTEEQILLLDKILLDHRKITRMYVIDLIARSTNLELTVE